MAENGQLKKTIKNSKGNFSLYFTLNWHSNEFKCKSKTKFNPFSIGKIEKLDFSYSNNSTKFKINN